MANRSLSVSIEPLVLKSADTDNESVLESIENGTRCQSIRNAKALFAFLLSLALLSLGGVLLIFLLPSLINLLIQFCQFEQQINYPISELINETKIRQQFEEFERNFARKWKSKSERRAKMGIFGRNLRQIEQLNAKAKERGQNVTYGVNGLTDIGEKEWQKTLCPLGPAERAEFIRPALKRTFSAKRGSDYPTHFDWREKGVVTPVKAQGLCGSCWAFASVATTESAYAIAHGELRSLSEQELLDCNLANNACKGGNVDKAFRFIHDIGLETEDEYPYLARRQNVCMMHEGNRNLTKIDVAVFINPDEQSMIDWLINFGPINVGISVPPDMKPYKSGIYHPSDFDCQFKVVGLHSMLVVGYGENVYGDKYWIVKNSWGQKWGQEHGYLNFARGVNACGIEDEPIGLMA
ncbi:hypothetical protein niasHT_007862 [Heterodera trifolii]|uniref:Uncharacterized protein n=1 Tax=Heterodera trifolii TaxID=157864 RepID=A0ABD2LZ87_9BILA